MWSLLLNLNTELGAGRKHEARTGVTTGDRMKVTRQVKPQNAPNPDEFFRICNMNIPGRH
jgi:hypothetical protein